MKQACDTLSIQYPIIQGGMGNISNAILTSAVSNAGGLGTIGCGTMSPDEIEQIISETKRRTEQPFALNIALTVSDYVDEIIQLAIKHNVSAISLSAGNPAPYIPKLNKTVFGPLSLSLRCVMRRKRKRQAQTYSLQKDMKRQESILR